MADSAPKAPRKRGWLFGLLVAVGFAAYLLWTTLSSQRVECHVCVTFNGAQRCADASAELEAEAARSAQTTACGTLTSGMNESIACGNRPPVVRQCRTR